MMTSHERGARPRRARGHDAGRARRSRRRARAGDGPPRIRLTDVDAVALGALQPGTVIYAHIPFADGSGSKLRPAVVLGRQGREVDVVPVRSSDQARKQTGALAVDGWEDAGLSRPSVVFAQIVPVDRVDIVDVAGQLDERDFAALLLRFEVL